MDNFIKYSDSFQYSSANAFFVAGDKTDLFTPGTRVRFTQISSGVEVTKFGLVVSSAYANSVTTVTLRPNSQYSLANAAISNPAYTHDYAVTDAEPALVPERRIAKVALTAGNANAFAFAWQNPLASKIIVDRVLIDITTAGGTASSVLDVGPAGDATSTADTLIDGLDLNAAALSDNISNGGTNGKARAKLDENGGTNDYITGKILAQNAASLAGYAYIHYYAV